MSEISVIIFNLFLGLFSRNWTRNQVSITTRASFQWFACHQWYLTEDLPSFTRRSARTPSRMQPAFNQSSNLYRYNLGAIYMFYLVDVCYSDIPLALNTVKRHLKKREDPHTWHGHIGQLFGFLTGKNIFDTWPQGLMTARARASNGQTEPRLNRLEPWFQS